MRFEYCTSIADMPSTVWNDLFHSPNPFVQHDFLRALELSGSVGAQTGWRPRHLVVTDDDVPLVVMPLYAKSHSYGEYVFDQGWAQAYANCGLGYYPKLVTAIPFSPVMGPRIGFAQSARSGELCATLMQGIRQLAEQEGYSGWHILFPGAELQQVLAKLPEDWALLQREAVQFHWFNRGYQNFDDFLATLRSSRRKNLNRERRLIREAGVTLQRKDGTEISDLEWQGFYRCYTATYQKRSGHDGYLNRDFFDLLRQTMAESLMLVVARRAGNIVASSLFLHDPHRLYGRYWGALEDISCLHFEACFYQGIEFCIERGLAQFDPGTQGEHKLIRGFEPVRSASYHWIADQRFRTAIAEFLQHEKRGVDQYQQAAEDYLPFRKADS